MDYITSSDLGTYAGATLGTVNLGNAALAIAAASRSVDEFCGRDFETGILTASTMQVEVRSLWRAETPRDFYSTAGLVVALDNDGDGTAETTLTTADYQLYPLNGYVVGVGTSSYYQIRLTSQAFQQCYNVRPVLHVTALWGWSAVPDVIKRATAMLALEMLKDPETPFGVIGVDNVGIMRLRANPRVANILQPFVRPSRAAMVA